MAKILIIGNGTITNKDFVNTYVIESDIIIAADGGANHCLAFDIQPHHVIGDFDSITQKAKNKFSDILQKDDSQQSTDMMKALKLAIKLHATHITILGGIGKRLDHTLANLLLLATMPIYTELVDESTTSIVISKPYTFLGKKGDIISIFALTNVTSLSYKGLKYKVTNKNVSAGWIGSSNEFSENKATISLKSGKVLVIRPREV